jgi:hypothetical protein
MRIDRTTTTEERDAMVTTTPGHEHGRPAGQEGRTHG